MIRRHQSLLSAQGVPKAFMLELFAAEKEFRRPTVIELGSYFSSSPIIFGPFLGDRFSDLSAILGPGPRAPVNSSVLARDVELR